MDDLLKKVPKELRPRFMEIVAILDRFCDQHLNDEYKELCRNSLLKNRLTGMLYWEANPH